MDCSIKGYLSRRTNEELEQIIALYSDSKDADYYADVLDIAKQLLRERGITRDKPD